MIPRILAVLVALSLPLAASHAHAQACGPGACGAGFQVVDFESLPVGASVEGPGAVHPDLTITSTAWTLGTSCAVGSARVIAEGNPFPYDAYTTSSGVDNGCLGGTHGFADDQVCVLDYEFTFAPGVSVSCFSIRMLDYGDFFPFVGTTHQVLLSGYDAGGGLVDQFDVTVLGGEALVDGDACASQAGDAGNIRLTVTGAGIVRVTLTFDAWPDPNVGYDEIGFCEEPIDPTAAGTWGVLKATYR